MEINLTSAAREAAVRDLGPEEHLRIAFAGGCGAMGFHLGATRRQAEGDLRLDLGGVTVVLDRMAARELDGAVLDHDPEEGFVIDHPSWGRSC